MFFLVHSAGAQRGDEVYRRALEEMAQANEPGFDSVWLAEHHFSNYGYGPNPLVLAVKAAQVARRVRNASARSRKRRSTYRRIRSRTT